MSKFKLFVENFLVYGFGGIISKAIPLVMLPIITRLMPDPLYYSLNDQPFHDVSASKPMILKC